MQAEKEDQIVLRDGKRFVARLRRLPPEDPEQDAVKFRADATYLITGGLGMLGLKIAHWLVEEQGVRYVVLMGRRGASDTAQETLASLKALGAHIHIIKADISIEADVHRLLKEIQRKLPPPERGIPLCRYPRRWYSQPARLAPIHSCHCT